MTRYHMSESCMPGLSGVVHSSRTRLQWCMMYQLGYQVLHPLLCLGLELRYTPHMGTLPEFGPERWAIRRGRICNYQEPLCSSSALAMASTGYESNPDWHVAPVWWSRVLTVAAASCPRRLSNMPSTAVAIWATVSSRGKLKRSLSSLC